MTRTHQQAVTLSIILHGGALIVALLMGAFDRFFEREPPQLLQLVDLSSMAPRPAQAAPAPDPAPMDEAPQPMTVAALDALEMPAFDELREIHAVELPEPAPPPQARPAPEPAPQPAARPQRVSLDQFRREHGAPKPTPARPQRTRPVATPRIESNATEELMRNIGVATLQASPSYSSAQQSELQRYVSGLVSQLRRHFRPPGGGNELTAWVRFTVLPDGTIRDMRIERSSGSAGFDAAVLAAFRSFGKSRPLPVGESVTWTVDFRNVE